MARQPLRPNPAVPNMAMAPWMIDEMPELATLIGRITVNWTGVDLHMALLLGSLIGVGNAAAVAVFVSLRNNRAQRDALIAAADVQLSDALKPGFTSLMDAHKRLDKQRNDVVHGVWGRNDDRADELIWSSLQSHASVLMRDYHAVPPDRPPDPGYDRGSNMIQGWHTYKYDDLDRLNADIRNLAAAAQDFHVHLRYGTQPAGARALENFLSNPVLRG